MKILNIGDKAPGFTVVSTDKQMVSLSDFAGKNVLLLFFSFCFYRNMYQGAMHDKR
jgi:peroxiredoxin